MKIFYFTATGNSLYVAKRLGNDDELYSIPQLLQRGELFFQDEIIGLVYPCYSFGLPRIVRQFLAQAQLEADYRFAVMTCGNNVGGALLTTKHLGEANGIHFDYFNYVKMVDNYLPLFDIDKQLQTLPQKRVDDQLDQMVQDIKSRKSKPPRVSPPIKLLTQFMKIGNSTLTSGKADHKFIVNASCNRCGICVKVCPAGNIKVQEPTISYQHNCESCFACIHVCPQNAIHLKNEKSATRYRNEHVSLKEIINANCQEKQN